MKKVIAIYTILATICWIVSPALTFADDVFSTGLLRGTGGGTAPMIMAKWEMNGPSWQGTQFVGIGTDDSTAVHSQFDAAGEYQSYMDYSICAIATDSNGASDIFGVYADIYYPTSVAIHDRYTPSHDLHPDATPWTSTSGSADLGKEGCGAFIEQNTLLKLSKTDGYNLFCNNIRNVYNNNLPWFFNGGSYETLCATDGLLQKEEAYVYCDDKHLWYEDPAGLYKVQVIAQDIAGNSSAVAENTFEYLPGTIVAADFTNVAYGEVLLNTEKKISGDLNFTTATRPTLRNLGNTRALISIAQDDMGLGQTSGNWNVTYNARVGNSEYDWLISRYLPFRYKADTTTLPDYTQLEDVLDLSEDEELDLSIKVTKWPDANTSYSGSMWIDVDAATFRVCN